MSRLVCVNYRIIYVTCYNENVEVM